MIKKLIILSTWLVTLGFAQEKPPEGILPKEQMAEILIDLQIAAVRANNYSNNEDSARMFLKEATFSIYKKHGIEEEAFQKSYRYYLEHPSEMEDIYKSVIDGLSLKERLAK